VTSCRSAMCPWQEYENLPPRLNAGHSHRGHIFGLPTYRQLTARILSVWPTNRDLTKSQ